MIDPQELRIGNLLELSATDPNTKEVLKFTGPVSGILHDKILMGSSEVSKEGIHTPFDMLSGIPLTEERLLKAGFTLSQLLVEDNEVPLVKDAYYGENPVTHDHLIHLKNTGSGWFYLNSHHKVPCVHSLQNLVYDLAGEELTFKD